MKAFFKKIIIIIAFKNCFKIIKILKKFNLKF